MRKTILLAVVLIMVAAVMTGCGRTAPSNQNSVDVAVDQALRLWQNKEAIIIDVRTPEEFREGHIPGVQLIPLAELGGRFSEVPKDKKVLIMCQSGNRSSQATKLLRDNGFTNVFNITVGMGAWPGPVEK